MKVVARILLVDDSSRDLSTMIEAAQGDDRQLVSATGPDQAISEINRGPFDLVVTDLCMPEGETTGFRVLSAAREKLIPVIMVTNYASPSRCRKALDGGAWDFLDRLATGVDSELLLRHKINQALELSRAQQILHASHSH
jgi:CheY-like chemotaxis protein